MTAILCKLLFPTVLKSDVKRKKHDGFWIKILELSYHNSLFTVNLKSDCISGIHPWS